MAVIMLVGCLFLATFGFVTGVENKTETYSAQSATDGITELTVKAELPGEIQWHSDSGDSVRIVVTKYAESISDIDNIIIEFQHTRESVVVTANTQPSPPNASGRNTANFLVLFTTILLTGTILFGGKSSKLFVVIVTLIICQMWYAFAQVDSTLSVNIDIHVPRNFSFKKVSLITVRGSIQVDHKLIDLETPLQCSSGSINIECPSCCSGNGKCINGECQCGIGYRNGTSDCDEQTETTLNLFTNPLDPVIIGAKTPDGDNIYMIGGKDSNGNPTKVQRFEVVDLDGNSTFTELDENGTITSAVHSSGMTMRFEWDSNYTSVQVTLVLPDLSQQITINIDLTDNTTNATLDLEDELFDKRSIDDIKIPQKRKQKLTHINYAEKEVRSKRDTTNSARVSINVLSCGQPEPDAIVQADASFDDSTTRYTAVPSDTSGLYYIYIPTVVSSTIGETIGEVCSAVEMVLDKACSWYGEAKKYIKYFTKHSVDKLVCYYLGNGIKLAIPQLRLIPVYKFCKAIFKGVNYYCDKVNAPILSGVIDKKKSELICELITDYTDNAIDFFRDTDVSLTPFAIFPTGHTVTGSSKVLSLPPGSSIVSTTFTIDDGTSLQITSLTVVPADPDPGQNYVVTVRYECYTSSTSVVMSIVGTDGYTDTISCSGGPSCVLYVPGAQALVQDTVTVRISDPSSPTITRTAFIVF